MKTDTTSVQTFQSLNRGPAGVAHTGKIQWFEPMDKKQGLASAFSVDGLDKLPRVDVIYAHANMSADLIERRSGMAPRASSWRASVTAT